MDNNWELDELDGALVVKGHDLNARSENGELGWDLIALDKERVLLSSKTSSHNMAGFDDGLARCSVNLFTDFLHGAHQRGFSGIVSVDTGRGIKKIYFQDGNICFAGSNLIDDRLGEVIYRSGKITLDQMADSAVKVNRAAKFGMVLLSSGVFNSLDLWAALKSQVLEILRSTFLAEHTYFQVQTGSSLSPTAVTFESTTSDIIDECAGFGCMFRAFMQRISAGSQVYVDDKHDLWREPQAGTFAGDAVAMLRQCATVQDVIDKSKLSDINTYVLLFTLVNQRMIKVEEVMDAAQPTAPVTLGSLKGIVDAFGILVQTSRAAFDADSIPFPLADVAAFAASLNPKSFVTIFVDERGNLARESILNIYAECAGNPRRTQGMLHKLHGLIQFLLQVTADSLPSARGRDVRKQFLELMP